MEETQIKSIDNYRVVGTIYKTPEGILYKAVEEVSGKNVLIKIYYPSMNWSEDSLNEFFDRAGYLKFIEHEYLLPILDIGKDQKKPYVVFPLDAFIFFRDFASHQLTQKQTIKLFSRIAEVIDFLHKQEIVHGSLNIENILVDDGGNPKLFDFGLSGVFKKLLTENIDDGFTNLSISDVRSSSPEQILGHAPNRGSDIYAFGMIFYYFLFGNFLFESQMATEVAVNHLSESIVKVEKTSRTASAIILRFIQKCIQYDPLSRFRSFAEIQKILERMHKGWPVRFSYKKRIIFVLSKKQAKLRFRLILGAAIFSVLALTLYFFQDRFAAMLDSAPTAVMVAEQVQAVADSTATEVANQILVETATAQPSDIPDPALAAVLTGSRPALESEKPRLPDEMISVFNLDQLVEYSRLGFGKPEDVDISSDPDYFALATSAGIFIYYQNQFETWLDPGQWATSVAFSTKGDILAVGLGSGEIQLWDWKNDTKLATLSGHSAKVTRILYSKNDLFLYSASFDQNIIVWNLKSQEIVHKIAAHSDPINNIAVSSDGRTLMSCSDDMLIRFWDLASGKKLFEFRALEKIEAIAFSPDNTYFAAGGDQGRIYQWDVISHQPRTDPIPVKKRIWSLEYVGDNKLLAGIDDGEYKLYNASQQSYDGTSRKFEIIEPPLSLYKIFGFGFKFDSYTASDTTGNALVSIRWDGEVNVGGTQILPPVYDNLDRLDISSDGTIMAVSGPRGMTAVWETDENRLLYLDTARLPYGDPISPDASSIIVDTGGYYQSIDLTDGSPLKKYFGLIPDGVISYADAGNILIAGNLTNSRVWDYASGYETHYSGYPDSGCRLTVSKNTGDILQINSAAGVFFTWNDVEKKVCALSQRTMSALSMNHEMLVYLASNGIIEGLDPIANELLWRLPEKEVTVLAVSPDGTMVVIGTRGGKMIFIDSRTGNAISEIVGNFGSLKAIEFSEDGMKIATTGYDGTVRLFGVIKNNN